MLEWPHLTAGDAARLGGAGVRVRKEEKRERGGVGERVAGQVERRAGRQVGLCAFF